ncbi:hypothetical protein C8Q80DRAFT_269122 [Daedaleopsis nitida]|nr:hypothetical protein C8Q80DRAFT_269122 [Daedaleopsis nitida]
MFKLHCIVVISFCLPVDCSVPGAGGRRHEIKHPVAQSLSCCKNAPLLGHWSHHRSPSGAANLLNVLGLALCPNVRVLYKWRNEGAAAHKDRANADAVTRFDVRHSGRSTYSQWPRTRVVPPWPATF